MKNFNKIPIKLSIVGGLIAMVALSGQMALADSISYPIVDTMQSATSNHTPMSLSSARH